ncbi:TPA: hypothetical protein ACP481_003646 [Escherichia coli]
MLISESAWEEMTCLFAPSLREAVDQYLINQSQTARTSVPGIWQGCEEDGVEYQRKLREEW